MDSRETLEISFPGLKQAPWDVKSPATIRYNCIGWALNDDQNWWWPHPDAYWPKDAPFTETIEAFLATFTAPIFGYEQCNTADIEFGYHKIALYADSMGKPTHAARQLQSGKWTSKLGKNVDIEHSLRALEGTAYGNVAVILKRRVPG